MKPLELTFYQREPVAVAKDLLGKILVHDTAEGQVSGKIVEVEAYGGLNDAASHISRGVTERTKIMLDQPGLAYVYLIYGVHHCFNVVAHTESEAGAVLIRAVEPVGGIPLMQQRRKSTSVIGLCSGPGKLCQAFAIDKALNGHLLSTAPLYITTGETIADSAIIATPRININYAQAAAAWPWRFYVKGSKFVSRK